MRPIGAPAPSGLCQPGLPGACRWTDHLLSLQIHETIETINQLKTQREFMLSFARDPQGFINDWLQSQCRDLKVKGLGKDSGTAAWLEEPRDHMF